MKTKLHIKRQVSNLLIVVFVLTGASKLFTQESKSSDLKDFKIVVEKTKNGIKLQSIKGCAWLDLRFQINNQQAQAIDEFGMTELNKTSNENDPSLANFLFTITKTENRIILKGIEGTAWKDLSFSLTENDKQLINQYGMTD